jgi:1,4-dihydroxy-2-naphthoate octaprenyltransferase
MTALFTLATALLLQVGANLANDYYDCLRGADGPGRLGPPRATQAGLIAPAAMRNAAYGVLSAAGVCGLYLVLIGGWPVALAGAAALVAAVTYTAGPWPIAYIGGGELFVLFFFGPLAVGGTVFLQTGAVGGLAAAVSLLPGSLAAAILAVNNLRDIEQDARVDKMTLAARYGEGWARREYRVLVLAPFALLPFLFPPAGTPALLPILCLPWAIIEVRRVAGSKGSALNRSLVRTAALHAAFGILLAVGMAV